VAVLLKKGGAAEDATHTAKWGVATVQLLRILLAHSLLGISSCATLLKSSKFTHIEEFTFLFF
jgi:hypothetical protein